MERDVTVKAPPMTPDGSVLLTVQEVDQYANEMKLVKMAAENMASMLICLILIHSDDGSNSVTIPSEMILRAKGSQLKLSEDARGNVTAQVLSRAPSLVVVGEK